MAVGRQIRVGMGRWESLMPIELGPRRSASLCTAQPATESSAVCYIKSIVLLH